MKDENTIENVPFKMELLECKLELSAISVNVERLKGACTAYENTMRRIAELTTDLIYDGVDDMRLKWINSYANNHLAEYYRIYPLEKGERVLPTENQEALPMEKEESDDTE